MTARTHDLAAVTALGIVFLVMPLQSVTLATVIVAIFSNLAGGIAPDIDQSTAPIWRNLPVGKYIGKFFDKILGGHRFISHSIIGLVLFGFLFHLMLQLLHPIMGSVNIGYVWWAFMIGMAAHLVMDTLTKEGVPWFLPIPVKLGFPPVKEWRITTGKWVETWVVFPLLLVVNGLIYSHYYQHLIYILHHKII
ncbi:MAG TPA: metal-dependent hydrolase [Candidatus Saccharimonadales bacterium]|jgi:inner membrane protein|nr:metal-dependent hydrolase [Candidatus Saccharimonadales bacterium]